MRKIVFAYPKHPYDSYATFRRLVEVSEFDWCYFENMDLSRDDVVYIVSPANKSLWDALGGHDASKVRARIIYWNLERADVPTKPIWELLTTEVNAATQSVRKIPGMIAAWVSDRYQAGLDEDHYYVTIAGDPRFAEGAPLPREWDLCHFMYVYGRRSPVVDELSRKLKVAPSGVTWERQVEILRSSRAILSIHQTPSPITECLRVAWSAAYKLPLLMEESSDPFPMIDEIHFKSIRYYDAVRRVQELLSEVNRDWMEAMGVARYDLLCVKNTFRSCVEEGVRRSL